MVNAEQSGVHMSNSRKTYWQFFNIAGRIVGVVFTFGGTIIVIFSLRGGDAIGAVLGLIVAMLGVLLLFAKSYKGV